VSASYIFWIASVPRAPYHWRPPRPFLQRKLCAPPVPRDAQLIVLIFAASLRISLSFSLSLSLSRRDPRYSEKRARRKYRKIDSHICFFFLFCLLFFLDSETHYRSYFNNSDTTRACFLASLSHYKIAMYPWKDIFTYNLMIYIYFLFFTDIRH